jgi:hypothetical protein
MLLSFHLRLLYGSCWHHGIALNCTIHDIRIIMYGLFSSWLDCTELLLGRLRVCTEEQVVMFRRIYGVSKFTGVINGIFREKYVRSYCCKFGKRRESP